MQAKKITVLIAFGIVLASLVPATALRANAAELHVGPSAQYHTISEAIKAANMGDTVLVNPGTYVENVMVDKPLSLIATDGAATTTVKATASTKDVFTFSGSDITIQGFTITGGKYGVTLAKASNCILSRCMVKDNTYGVYLAGASANLISNNNLNDNGFGMYLDGSSGNKLVNNSARHEKGGGGNASLSDGIYMHSSNANNVSRCDLSDNDNFGASLYASRSNVFSHNTFSSNTQFGVRLRDGSNSNGFVYNTFRANTENGVLIGNSTGNTFYFNNFLEEKSHFYSQQNNNVNSTHKLNYTYADALFNGFVGNYYSDYNGTDVDGNGMGAPAFMKDQFPLVKPIENYHEGWPTPTPTPSIPPSGTVTATENITTEMQSGERAPAFLPGFELTDGLLGVLVAATVLTILRRTKMLR